MNYSEQLKSPMWQKKRLKIMERDNFTCRSCGSNDKQLNVHHYIYKKDCMAWEYDDKLLVSLCGNCHDAIHSLSKVFDVDFVVFTCDVLRDGLTSDNDIMRDFSTSFKEKYKDISDALFDYAEHGGIVVISDKTDVTYGTISCVFDKENKVIWIDNFFTAK